MNIHHMTREEAVTIAVLRVHFHCTYSKISGLAKAIWGQKYAMCMAGTDSPARLGEQLIATMERVLGLQSCESDNMVLEEGICLECKNTEWSLCYPSDVGKECGSCGKMTWMLPPSEEG